MQINSLHHLTYDFMCVKKCGKILKDIVVDVVLFLAKK